MEEETRKAYMPLPARKFQTRPLKVSVGVREHFGLRMLLPFLIWKEFGQGYAGGCQL
jgi:hypothetical protein